MIRFTFSNAKPETWYIGDRIATPWYVAKCIEVEATREELEVILNCFNNIPSVKPEIRDVQMWHGEFARFIWTNFPHK